MEKSLYRREVKQLSLWCSNWTHAKVWRKPGEKPPITVPPIQQHCIGCGILKSFRFLGYTVFQGLKWESNISTVIKKTQQRMYFLCQLRKYSLPQELLIQFYTTVIESVLYTSVTVWFGLATKQDKHSLQHTVRSAERIIGTTLLTIQNLNTTRVKSGQENHCRPLRPWP